MPPETTPAIEVSDLVVRYGDLTAVDGVSFTVAPGTICALLGPNGAGKTSTVETLEGFRPPTSGSVRVLGLDPQADQRQLLPQLGVMLQQGGVYTAMRPPEALRLFAAYYDDPADPEELLQRVGLQDRRRSSYRSLSGGEQQRLSLALALVGRPRLAFLDEPTAGIDPAGRQLIRSVVAGLRDEGVTVLLTTHDLDEAEKLADQVVIMDHGRVLADGSPAELMAGGPEDLRFGAPTGIDVDGLATHLAAPVAEVAPGEYVVAVAPTPTAVAALTAWLAEHELPLADLRAGRQRLEDVFLRLTAEQPAPAVAREAGHGRRQGRRGGRR